jgi:hypothetical protein
LLFSELPQYPGPWSLSKSHLIQHTDYKKYILSERPSSLNDVELSGQFPSPIVAESVALFFRWQYPNCNFIDREEFLLGYLNHSYGGKHPSPALEYAICSLGALMSIKRETRNFAQHFSSAAIRTLEVEGLLNPKDTSIQALLCCSLFQAGQGNLSKAWMVSGIIPRRIYAPT